LLSDDGVHLIQLHEAERAKGRIAILERLLEERVQLLAARDNLPSDASPQEVIATQGKLIGWASNALFDYLTAELEELQTLLRTEEGTGTRPSLPLWQRKAVCSL
jgi:hypothetical protein